MNNALIESLRRAVEAAPDDLTLRRPQSALNGKRPWCASTASRRSG